MYDILKLVFPFIMKIVGNLLDIFFLHFICREHFFTSKKFGIWVCVCGSLPAKLKFKLIECMHWVPSIYSGNTVPISGGRSIRIAMNGSVKEPNHMIATLGKWSRVDLSFIFQHIETNLLCVEQASFLISIEKWKHCRWIVLKFSYQ